MTYVLITRPLPEGQLLQDQLQKMPAIDSFCEPMLHIVPQQSQLAMETTGDNPVTDLIVTSARVFDIIENWSTYTHLPLWCVGDVTAQAAKEKGFTTVHCAQRSAKELLENIIHETEENKTHHRFVHICGDTLHLDLATALTELEYKAEKNPVYQTQATTTLSKKFLELLIKKSFGIAPFFSLRTTEIFVDLIKKHNLQKYFSTIQALAHSDAIVQKLKELPWAKIHVVPDLGEEKIRFFHNDLSHETKKNTTTPPSSSKMFFSLQSPYLAGTLGGFILAFLLSLSFFQFILIPYNLSAYNESLQKQLNDQHTTVTQKHLSELTNLLGEQKIALEKEIQTLKKEISTVKKSVSHISTRVSDVLEHPRPLSPENTSQSLASFIQYQKISEYIDQIKKSSLDKEGQVFLKTNGFHDPAEGDILSIPQLLTTFHALNFTVYTEESATGGKFFSFLQNQLGAQVQKKSQLPLKQEIISDLQQKQFSFLKDLDAKKGTLPEPLATDFNNWISQAQQTHQVLEKLSQYQKNFQTRPQPSPAFPEQPVPPQPASPSPENH